MIKDVTASRPIFIVGMNGSGTTMLLNSLNSHPGLYGYPRETTIFPHYISNLKKYGDLNKDSNFLQLFNDIANEHKFRRENKGKPIPIPENWRQLPHTLATVIDSTMTYFASAEGKNRWCEKTPMHVLYMSTLSQLFPSAKFIHIIRDGKACAASFHRRWHHKPEFTMYRWKTVIRKGRASAVELNNKYFEIFYEDLTRSPEKFLRELCTFLEVPYDKAMLHVSRVSSDAPSPSNKIVSNSGKWRTYLSDKQAERLDKIGGSLLSELGYPTMHPESDVNPSRLLLTYWAYKDYLKKELSILTKTLTRKRSQKIFHNRLSMLKMKLKLFLKFKN